MQEGITPAVVEGDSYHRYERMPMKQAMADALAKGENFSHFGPEANLFDKLEELFRTYGETGAGQKRYYLHSPKKLQNITLVLASTSSRVSSRLGRHPCGH